MRYLPHTEEDIARMLQVIGAGSMEELFRSIPAADRLTRPMDLPAPADETTLLSSLRDMAGVNRSPTDCGGPLAFLGAGAHQHVVPHAVDQIISRAEFLTAYTPYQPEVSQGTLQSVFEFQTGVAELFGLQVANASLYDGATAAAEALLMARRIAKHARFVISEGVHPETLETCRTFLGGMEGAELVTVGLTPEGRTDPDAVATALADAPTAALLFQSPNFLGVVEDQRALAERAHDAKALAIASVAEPVSLGLLEPPGACGCDIAVGEGLGFAVPVSFGGPGVGLFATLDRHKRQIPGRLVGQTVDSDGVRGYVLTLATREQHIRRERATSNICTNQALIALCFTIQLSLLGKTGFQRLARLNFAKAQHARSSIQALPGYRLRHTGPTFNEFAVQVPGGDASALVSRVAASENLVAGVDLGRFRSDWADTLLINVTELHRRQDIDRLVAALAAHGKGA